MKKIYYLKGIITGLLCFCMIMLAFAPLSSAQSFISREDRPRWNDRYENFSNYDYRNFSETPTLIESQRIGSTDMEYVNPVWHGQADPFSFDELGNFLLPGGDVYNMTWDRSDVGTDEDFGSNSRIFNNLMISSDEFSNWMTKFIIGQNIRAYFTPSTMKLTNLDGFRWDASSRKNSFTFVADVGTHDTRDRNMIGRNLFGAHWESVLGDVLKLGGTFVMNQRGTSSYSNVDIATGTGRTDTLNLKDMERYVYVAITSDTPEDERINARVFEVKAFINGEESNIPQRAFKIPDILHIKKFTDDKFSENEPLWGETSTQTVSTLYEISEDDWYNKGSWFLRLISKDNSDAIRKQIFQKGAGSSGLKGYLNIQSFNDPTNPQGRYFWDDPESDPSGISPEEQFESQGYLEAKGTDVIIYEFLIPSGARSVNFAARVANDYCIDVIAALPNKAQNGVGPWDLSPDNPENTYDAWASSFSGNWNPIWDLKHCVKAPGKVVDMSNTQWVNLSYDRLTGMNVYGLNAELNWRGLFVRAEFNEYNTLWSYPIHSLYKGEDRNKESTRAWFVNIEKDFGNWSVGGEFFDYPNEYMQYWATIDDNDDNNHTTGGNNNEYPGLNINWDSAGGQEIDTDFAGRPYITYYFDQVDFGDDFNHNGIIDERENDDAIDLPYERDSRGEHFFLKLRPSELTSMTFGHYDIDQEYMGGRNLTDYFKFEHMQRFGSVLDVGIFHRTERVQDTYRSNDAYRQYWAPDGDFNTLVRNADGDADDGTYQGHFSNIAFKNSLYNTSMLKTKLSLIPNLNIYNNFKYDAINRIGDLDIIGSAYQRQFKAPRDIIKSTSVHKIDYEFRLADFRLIPDIFWNGIRIFREKRIKEFRIMPQFKFINSYFTGNFSMRHNGGHSYSYYPVLRLDYRVAPRTMLRLAMQGFPGLMEKKRNSVDRLNETNERRMFLGFETRTLYSGFNLLVTSGMRRTKEEWVRSFGRPETGQTQYFITLRVESSR